MKNKIQILIALLLIILCGEVVADYNLERIVSLDYSSDIILEGEYINHNYGEYRGSAGYMYHDGMDYFIPLKSRITHMPIYPVSSGTAHVYPDPTKKVTKSKIPAGEFDAIKHLFIDPTQSIPVFKPNTISASIEACFVPDATKLILQQGLIGSKEGWGHCVIVDHTTFQTRYAHLSSIKINRKGNKQC